MATISNAPWGQTTQADYSPEQWRRACVVDRGQGDPAAKDRYALPVREPDGTLNRNGVRAAAGGLGTVHGLTADQRRSTARHLVGLYTDLNEEPPDSLLGMAGQGRAREEAWSDAIMRTLPLDDLAIRSGHLTCERCGRDATGRMVDAYATPFNISTEIRDQHGHYNEVIDPVAFNRTLRNGYQDVGVYYHHGMTLHGTPSGEGAFPLGHPSAVRADGRGLFTSTHYSTNDVGERTLQLIKDGTITGQSFSGKIYRSDPNRVRGALGPRRDGSLPTVRRLELGLREYGPTPSPAYTEAQILATRAAMGLLLPGQHSGFGPAGWAPPPPPDVEPGTEDPRERAHSGRQKILRLKAELRRMELPLNGQASQREAR